MIPDEATNPGTETPATTQAQTPVRRPRRSGRGHRGRGRRPHMPRGPLPAHEPQLHQPEPPAEAVAEPLLPAAEPAAPETGSSPAPGPDIQPGSTQTIQETIQVVTHVVDTLRETLEDMEQVLETLELFERQKDADEREIQSLRRALRPLHKRDAARREP